MENSTIGTFTSDCIIAYSVLYLPDERKDNFGANINLPRDELNRVVRQATVAIYPAYTGNSLHSMMQGIHLELPGEWDTIMHAAWYRPRIVQVFKIFSPMAGS